MKMIRPLALAFALGLTSPLLFSQGPLTPPPGTPAPTMKTLTEVEPRVAVNAANTPGDAGTQFRITQRGSYYLTTSISVASGDAIAIAADNVSLDLNGFTIVSTAPSATGTGILLSGGRTNVAIFNGFIQSGVTVNGSGTFEGSGFDNGIYYTPAIPVNIRITNVSISGCLTYGIYLGPNRNGTVVDSCTVNSVGTEGINADTVVNCTSFLCGSDAIVANQASHCHGMSLTGVGLRAQEAQNCYATTSTGFAGLVATTAENCWGQSFSSAGSGMLAGVAQNCQGSCNGNNTGLTASSANNCFGTSTGSGIGLSVTRNAANCWGTSASGTGLSAVSASNCSGTSTNGAGLFAERTAQNCVGTGRTTGLQTRIAIGCYGQGTLGYGVNAYIANSCDGVGSPIGVGASFKYNMP